jgi:5-formyltetrahydrofolate cyclo-ligase
MTHADPATDAAKKALRARAVAARAAACREVGKAAAQALARLAPALPIPAGAVVAGYWPMGDEIDPRPLMARLAARGCSLALPVVTAPGQALDFRAWAPGEPLEAGRYGTRHPALSALPLVPTVLLVPLVAFDRSGGRLGYGGGYYDRTLERLRARSQVVAIGVAFAAQEVSLVPRDRHDQPLDLVLTEAGLSTMETR